MGSGHQDQVAGPSRGGGACEGPAESDGQVAESDGEMEDAEDGVEWPVPFVVYGDNSHLDEGGQKLRSDF